MKYLNLLILLFFSHNEIYCIARDTFALLPVKKTHVTVEIEERIVIDVYFDKKRFDAIKFAYSDPSEIIEYFKGTTLL